MKNDELLHKWVNGEISKEELEVFKTRPEFASLTALYKSTKGLSAPDFDDKKMLSNILAEKKEASITKPTGRRVFLSSWVKYAAAASILLFATWFMWPTDTTVTVTANASEQIMGMLPDNSMFTLNAGSELSYDSEDWKKERSIHLIGEAFFEVEKGEKFTVNTANGQVKVLGTSFNVRSRDASLEVICRTGKVGVSSIAGKDFGVLMPQDAISISKDVLVDKWQVSKVAGKNWMDGIIRFKSAKLAEVISELERQFDIKINTQNIDIQQVVSCNFQNKNLDTALMTTLSPLGIEYVVEGKMVKLSK
jgi:ferric-dicitrate binding protein FerR (iron transport regulator)